MQQLTQGAEGLGLLIKLNLDRLLFTGAIFVALTAAVHVAILQLPTAF